MLFQAPNPLQNEASWGLEDAFQALITSQNEGLGSQNKASITRPFASQNEACRAWKMLFQNPNHFTK
jgi:hypothetical protein